MAAFAENTSLYCDSIPAEKVRRRTGTQRWAVLAVAAVEWAAVVVAVLAFVAAGLAVVWFG